MIMFLFIDGRNSWEFDLKTFCSTTVVSVYFIHNYSVM